MRTNADRRKDQNVVSRSGAHREEELALSFQRLLAPGLLVVITGANGSEVRSELPKLNSREFPIVINESVQAHVDVWSDLLNRILANVYHPGEHDRIAAQQGVVSPDIVDSELLERCEEKGGVREIEKLERDRAPLVAENAVE